MSWRGVARLLLYAFLFGVVAAAVKGQSGDGLGLISRVRSDIGNLSTPWVLVAWFGGSRTERLPVATVLGLSATLVALLGFYLVSGIVEPMGAGGVVGDSGSWILANRVYFVAGLVSGPVFGLFGGWWTRYRSPSAPIVVGLLLAGEPVVLLVTGAIFPNGVLSPLTGLPLVVRIVPAFGLRTGDTVSMAVYAVECVAGLVLVAGVVRSRRAARRSSTLAA